MEISDDYLYLALRDAASSVGQKVNLLAAVVDHGFPKKTKGTDYVCTLKIMDPSYQDRGFAVNMFINKVDKMPNIKCLGDIICLHRVTVKIYEGAAYALFDKKYSNFALFGGKPGDSFNPYQVFSKFHITEHGKEYITQLRTWLVDHRSDVGLITYLVKLKEIKVGGFFDLICKVLHVSKDPEEKWVIFVWDGTDVPPMSLQGNLDVEAKNPLPLWLEKSLLQRDVLCKFPCLGTVLRIFADGSCENLGLQSINTGQWVKFRRMMFQSQFGMVHGVLTSSSRVSMIPEEDTTASMCKMSYEERVSCKVEHLPMSCFPNPSPITVTDYDDVTSFSTLMDVLTCSKVTQKFKCVVRVVAILPWRAEDFRSPTGTHVYRIRLTLEDPTARIHAYVYAEDGEKFFEGYPSTNVLTGKMNKLLGITEGNSQEDAEVSRNPPWVECCIKSYYLDKSNPWETRNYRIFGTTVVE